MYEKECSPSNLKYSMQKHVKSISQFQVTAGSFDSYIYSTMNLLEAFHNPWVTYRSLKSCILIVTT